MSATRIANGVVQAYFAASPGFATARKAVGRKALGIRYEKKVQEMLLELSPCYVPSPWLRFQDVNGWHWCQPDGIHLDFARGQLTIVEVKYQHTPAAWVQLLELYSPALRAMFPSHLWRFQYLEIVRWYDPDVKATSGLRQIAHPFGQVYEKGVHIWK